MMNYHNITTSQTTTMIVWTVVTPNNDHNERSNNAEGWQWTTEIRPTKRTFTYLLFPGIRQLTSGRQEIIELEREVIYRILVSSHNRGKLTSRRCLRITDRH